ncbi:hypothetical protein AB0N14_15705 [Streptomyces sp. NPDC051104]|uniref:hypothetical protein n=1 Tax=Streptomyces sp. NPDC051104 TaxID=3155044 RepID=UPI00342FA3CA
MRYASGATLTYHLTAYAPWEGYRIAFNGSEGRLELLVEESTWSPRRTRDGATGPVLHGAETDARAGRTELLLRRFWERPRPGGGGDRRGRARRWGRADADGAVRRARRGPAGAGGGRHGRGALPGDGAGREPVVRDRTAVRARELLDV